MEKLTADAVIKMMDSRYTLVYLDRSNNLENSIEVLGECVANKNQDALYDHISDWFMDCEDDAIVAIVDGLKEELYEQGYAEQYIDDFFDENDDEIRSAIYGRDDSNRLDNLIGYTKPLPIRVEMHSNYDCINSHYFEETYSYEKSYFGDMVNALNLNPAKVKEVFDQYEIESVGNFPDLSERNGLEYVDYVEFATEIVNSISSVNLLTFTAMINVAQLQEHNFSIDTIIIPKGNECGLYSPSQGGGSIMSMELKRDITIKLNADDYDYFSLQIDGDTDRAHSMKEVYGMVDSAFGKLISIVKENKAA